MEDSTTTIAYLTIAKGIFKTLFEACQSVGDSSSKKKIEEAIGKANQALLDAYSSALDHQANEIRLNEEVISLKKKIGDFEKWEKRAERYTLENLLPGAMSYARVFRPKEQDPEPHETAHYACPECFENKVISILNNKFDGGTEIRCKRCKYVIQYKANPLTPNSYNSGLKEYDPLG